MCQEGEKGGREFFLKYESFQQTRTYQQPYRQLRSNAALKRRPCPPPQIDPGTIDDRRCVAARDGFVEILEIQPSSGRHMIRADHLNGRHVTSGDAFV